MAEEDSDFVVLDALIGSLSSAIAKKNICAGADGEFDESEIFSESSLVEYGRSRIVVEVGGIEEGGAWRVEKVEKGGRWGVVDGGEDVGVEERAVRSGEKGPGILTIMRQNRDRGQAKRTHHRWL